MGFRDFYHYNLTDWYIHELKYHRPYNALRNAKYKLRMYANLFCRDMRKVLINDDSFCIICGDTYKLQIDHVKSIFRWGENKIENVQILCSKCNRLKSHGK